jgi:hypothetical protein
VAAAITRDVSVAVKTQAPVVANSTVEYVATPAIAVTGTAAARQGDAIDTTSVDPAPVVSTFPLASSTETLNVVTTVPVAATVVGGAVVNASFAGVPPVTVTSVLD